MRITEHSDIFQLENGNWIACDRDGRRLGPTANTEYTTQAEAEACAIRHADCLGYAAWSRMLGGGYDPTD